MVQLGGLDTVVDCGWLLLWGAISPRSQWQKLFAWRYRNPEANEPSDAV